MNLRSIILGSCLTVCSSLFFPAPAQTLGNLPPGAYQLGPYPVGQTTAIVQDKKRDGGTTATTWTGLPYGITPYIGMKHGQPYGRQWILDIFYPADSASITPSTPKANFFNIPAATWEQNGIHVGYDGVPVAQDRTFPLVIFIDGVEDDSSENSSQAYQLASQGMVVAMIRFCGGDFDWPDWSGTVWWGTSEGACKALAYRGVDATQSIDLMLNKNSDIHDRFFATIDQKKIAVMGWSWGGVAALSMTFGLDNVRGYPFAIPVDPRVKAVVGEDPSTWALYYSQLENMNIPCLFLGSTQWDGLMSPRPFNANRGEEYKVKIINSVHDSFANDDCNLEGVLLAQGINFPIANFDQCSTPGVALPSICSPIIYGYTTAWLKKVLDCDDTYAAYFDPCQVYPNENGLFYFIDKKGGDTPYDLTTMLEDLSSPVPSFVDQYPSGFIFDGTFNFWETQPPTCGN